MDETLIASVLASAVRLATPLVLCALAGLFSERSGVVDIGLEGKMLFAAFAAGAAGAFTGSTTLALLAAMVVGVMLSALHGLACVSHPGDQVVSGVALNIIAAGLTVVEQRAQRTPQARPGAAPVFTPRFYCCLAAAQRMHGSRRSR